MRRQLLQLLLILPAAAAADRPLVTVPSVDLSRYAGEWYEVSRTPNRYESDCVADVKIDYRLRPDGNLGVRNTCLKANGKLDVANGYAKAANPPSNSKLRVTFFWPFSSDYWIIDLDPDYGYAVVGEPERKNLWILSRKPVMEAAVYDSIVKRAQAQGYDTSRLAQTPQGK